MMRIRRWQEVEPMFKQSGAVYELIRKLEKTYDMMIASMTWCRVFHRIFHLLGGMLNGFMHG